MFPDIKGVLFVSGVSTDSGYIRGAIHVERDDEVMMFSNDYTAAVEATKYGITFINDIQGLPVNTFIDFPENRKIVEDAMQIPWVVEMMQESWNCNIFSLETAQAYFGENQEGI